MSEPKLSVDNATTVALHNEELYGSIQCPTQNNQLNSFHVPLWYPDQNFSFLNQQKIGNFSSVNNAPNCSSNNADTDDVDELLKIFAEQYPVIPIQPSNFEPVALSSTVGVRNISKLMRQQHRIELVIAVEDSYKPRYKSDYFAQNGTTRPPRFVTDCEGHHFITLRILSGLTGLIRVDWVTAKQINGIRYSMPYKFQVDHERPDENDSNPAYYQIVADGNGLMKILLALIKSKQSELLAAQPLVPFPPNQSSPESNDMMQACPMPAKDLIEKYQLTTSQLAFTYCAVNPDESLLFDWSSTIYSGELKEQIVEGSKKRNISCPKCSHCFELIAKDSNDSMSERSTKKKR